MLSKTFGSGVSALTAAALHRADYCRDGCSVKTWVEAHVVIDFYNEVRVSVANLVFTGPDTVNFHVEVTRANSKMALVAPIHEQCAPACLKLADLLESKIAKAEAAEAALCRGLRQKFGRPTAHYHEVYQPNISAHAVEREFYRYDGSLTS